MANPLSIYSGPGQISVYDATNNVLHLGYSKEIEISGEAQTIELLDGNLTQYSTLYKLSAQLLQSNQSIITGLSGRRGTKQEIIVVGLESLVRMRNVFPATKVNRPYGNPTNAHVIELLAQTAVEADVTHYENLLAADGKFETDSNSDGIADGWTAQSGVTGSLVASFVSGGGNAQRVNASGVVDDLGIYYDVLAPFDQETQFTFSIYAKNGDATTSQTMKIFIEILDVNGTSLATYTSSNTFAASENKRINMTQKINPSSPVKTVRVGVQLPMSTTWDFDNAQLELGGLTDFKAA